MGALNPEQVVELAAAAKQVADAQTIRATMQGHMGRAGTITLTSPGKPKVVIDSFSTNSMDSIRQAVMGECDSSEVHGESAFQNLIGCSFTVAH